MHNRLPWMLLACGVLFSACGSSPETPGPDPSRGTGGSQSASGGSSGSGGKPGGSGGQPSSAGSGGATGSGGSTATGGTPGTGGTSAGSGGTTSSPAPDAAADTGSDAPSAPPTGGGALPFGCTGCKPIFDGKTLEGWETRDPTNWLAKDGVLASQGKVAPIWTKPDFGDYRIFFKVRQVKGDHRPDVIFFGKRPGPGAGGSGALGGAQFQPPNGGSWDYGAGGTFNRPENPMWDWHLWHHCEVLVKEAGSFTAACAPMEPEGACKTVLTWKGTGRKHPFAIQMHNPGLFDEYKDIYVEESPTVDSLLCLKK